MGILKELIQNADDAKATRVEITLDWRNHLVKDTVGCVAIDNLSIDSKISQRRTLQDYKPIAQKAPQE